MVQCFYESCWTMQIRVLINGAQKTLFLFWQLIIVEELQERNFSKKKTLKRPIVDFCH